LSTSESIFSASGVDGHTPYRPFECSFDDLTRPNPFPSPEPPVPPPSTLSLSPPPTSIGNEAPNNNWGLSSPVSVDEELHIKPSTSTAAAAAAAEAVAAADAVAAVAAAAVAAAAHPILAGPSRRMGNSKKVRRFRIRKRLH
jgi:hypothetical protein